MLVFMLEFHNDHNSTCPKIIWSLATNFSKNKLDVHSEINILFWYVEFVSSHNGCKACFFKKKLEWDLCNLWTETESKKNSTESDKVVRVPVMWILTSFS